MTVRPNELQNPEREAPPLTNRGPAATPAAPQTEEEKGKKKRDDPAAELEAFRKRLDGARGIQPSIEELHCRDCFDRGRDAAIRAIEGPKPS